MPGLRNLISREVRRTRHISASIKAQNRTLAECDVMDISAARDQQPNTKTKAPKAPPARPAKP
jgi:hypothetical protein